jgi:hypothetical protein
MGTVALGHPYVGLAKLAGDDGERNTRHREAATVCVAQNMEADRRLDAGMLAGDGQPALLVALSPRLAVGPLQHGRRTGSAGNYSCEKFLAFVAQDDVASFPALAGANRYGADLGVEIRCTQRDKLAISAAGQQRAPNHRPEILGASIYQADAFRLGQIPDHGRICVAIRCDAPPCIVAGDLALSPSMVQSGLQDGENAIGGCPPLAPHIRISGGMDLDSLGAFASAPARRCIGQLAEPLPQHAWR